jgi:hypothetical protein
MRDVEQRISESFARLYPVPAVTVDWEDILDRSGVRRRYRVGHLGPMWTRRRLILALALALAIAAALFASILFSNSPGVLERAQAALDPNGRILHVVSKQVDDHTTLSEWWSLPDASLSHVTSRYPSEPFGSDCVISETETRCWNPAQSVIDVYRHEPPEPGLPKNEPQFRIDQSESLSTALASGYARLLGETTFDGRPVIAVLLAAWTTHSPPPEFLAGSSHTVYLDPKTYLPVAERVPEGQATIYYQTFEFLPNTAENRKALELPAPADAKVVVHPVGEGPPEGK